MSPWTIAIKAGPPWHCGDGQRRLCGSHQPRLSSSVVSTCMHLSAVRKLSSRMSERNSDQLVLVHVATRGYDSEAWSELQLASLAYLRLLNSSTTYQHWPDWLQQPFLWLALLTKVPQLQQWLLHSLFASCTIIWLTCNHMNSHAILGNNCIHYVLEG